MVEYNLLDTIKCNIWILISLWINVKKDLLCVLQHTNLQCWFEGYGSNDKKNGHIWRASDVSCSSCPVLLSRYYNALHHNILIKYLAHFLHFLHVLDKGAITIFWHITRSFIWLFWQLVWQNKKRKNNDG